MNPAYFIGNKTQWDKTAIVIVDKDNPNSYESSFIVDRDGTISSKKSNSYLGCSAYVRDGAWKETNLLEALTQLDSNVPAKDAALLILNNTQVKSKRIAGHMMNFNGDGSISYRCTIFSKDNVELIINTWKEVNESLKESK